MPIELFTSRYQTFRDRMGVPVRTTISPPRWKLPYPLTHQIPEIAPSRAFFRAPRPVFEEKYREKLDAVGPAPLIEKMQAIAAAAGDGRLILLCYEDLTKPDLWCHRTLFAAWWTEKTGQAVREITTTEPVRPIPQTRLF